MYQLRNLIIRTAVPSDPEKNMNSCEDFLLLLLHAHVVDSYRIQPTPYFSLQNLLLTTSFVFRTWQTYQLLNVMMGCMCMQQSCSLSHCCSMRSMMPSKKPMETEYSTTGSFSTSFSRICLTRTMPKRLLIFWCNTTALFLRGRRLSFYGADVSTPKVMLEQIYHAISIWIGGWSQSFGVWGPMWDQLQLWRQGKQLLVFIVSAKFLKSKLQLLTINTDFLLLEKTSTLC